MRKEMKKHIAKETEPGEFTSVCGGGGTLVEAALESDCNKCRAAVNVAPTDQKGCEPRPPLVYEQQPELCDKRGKPYERDKT